MALGVGVFAASRVVEAAQAETGTIRIDVIDATAPVSGATVSAGGRSATTDAAGVATLTLPAGSISLTAAKDGYEPATIAVDVVAGTGRTVQLVLTSTRTEQDQSARATATTTRSYLPVEEQAVPIEVLDRNALEDRLLSTPGSIARSLDAMSSLRVRTTSPELGLAMVRVQGMRGQHTRLLSDGVPLHFDLPGGLAPVQIPSMDLDRIELVAGGASALFGANAMAGVVNLLSLRPGSAPDREILFSQSARGGTDGSLWISSPSTGSWSRTFLASVHHQNETDVDDDGWSDIPEYSRGSVRQRVFWKNGQGRSASGTAGVTFETREGGSAIARQSLETRAADGALFGQMPLGRHVLAGAATLYVQSRTREFSDVTEHERRQGATIELELRGTSPRQTWVAGIAADWFAIRSRDPRPTTYLSTRPGIFVHDDMRVTPWLSVSGSARLDHHNIFGFFVSPRGSVRVHNRRWAAGFSAGRSYFAPTAHMEETEAAGLSRLSVEGPLHVETARHASTHLSHTTRASALTLTLFHSRLDHPAHIDRETYTLSSAAEPIATRGVEVLGTARAAAFAVTGTYAFVHARERGRDVALTPRHNARLVATVDAGRHGQIGLRVGFTGAQRLEANPYRSRSEPYTVVALFAERPFGRWRLFIAGENLTDVRQADWDPIARPSRDVDGRWTVDAWAPLEGRVINAGIRVSF